MALKYIRKLVPNLSDRISPHTTEGKVKLTDDPKFVDFDIIRDPTFSTSFDCQETATYPPCEAHILNTLKMVVFISATKSFPARERIMKKATLGCPNSIGQLVGIRRLRMHGIYAQEATWISELQFFPCMEIMRLRKNKK